MTSEEFSLDTLIELNKTELVKYLAHKGLNDWTYGFRLACMYGHYEIVKFLIDRYLPSLTHVLSISLRCACMVREKTTNHENIIKLLLECGAEDFGHVFRRACGNGNISELMCYLNFDWEDVIGDAYEYGNEDMIYILIQDEDF